MVMIKGALRDRYFVSGRCILYIQLHSRPQLMVTLRGSSRKQSHALDKINLSLKVWYDQGIVYRIYINFENFNDDTASVEQRLYL